MILKTFIFTIYRFVICNFIQCSAGKGWENHIEGQKLKADGDSFRMKLSTQDIFDDWARKVQQRNIGVTGRIFTIDSVRSRSGRGNVLKLKVNFLPEIITLSKEVRNLKNLGFRVPLAIVNKAHQANQLYPFAISLIESIRTYERTLEKVRNTVSDFKLNKCYSISYRTCSTWICSDIALVPFL